MTEKYNMDESNTSYETITCIQKFFCAKEAEHHHIVNLKTLDQWETYKKVCKNEHSNQPVYMEYYTNTSLIKPFFDIDILIEEKCKKKEIKDTNENVRCGCKSVIETHYPDKELIVLNRPMRKIIDNEKIKLKISYRIIVNNVITNVDNLKQVVLKFKNENPVLDQYFDKNVYRSGSNKLCMFGGVKPFNKKKDIEDDAPKPFQFFYEEDLKKYTIFDTAITYIKPDFKKYLELVIIPEVQNKQNVPNVLINCNKQEEENDDKDTITERKSEFFIAKVKSHLLALNNNRAIEYNDWFLTICIICNMYEKYGWSRDTLYDLAHKFSEKGVDKYDYAETDKKIASALASNRNAKVGFNRLLKMLKEDNPEYCKKYILPNYNELKQSFEQEICFINNPTCFYRNPLIPRKITEDSNLGDITQQLTQAQIGIMKRNIYYEKIITEVNKNGKTVIKYVMTPFLTRWLDDPDRLTYEGIRFAPNGLSKEESIYYKNLFNGFQADRIDLTDDVDYTKIQPILDHIKKVLANNNEEHYKYLLNWFSRIVKNPEKRPKVGLVFYSDEHGVGKNIFTNYFANEILGFDLSVSAKNVDHILGKFNSLLAKCMFLVIEEASGDIKKFMEQLKNIITEPSFVIEKKNIDAGTYRNFINLLFNTNNPNILDIDDKDRRFVILEIANMMKGNKEYFKKLAECMENKQNTALFIKYLRDIECNWTEADFQDYRPITAAYKRQQQLSVRNHMKFMSHITKEDGLSLNHKGEVRNPWKKYKGRLTVCVKKTDVYDHYKLICDKYRYPNVYPFDQFIEKLIAKNTGITEVIKDRFQCLKFDKKEVLQWLELFRNSANKNIEIYKESEETEDDGWLSDN